MFDLCSTSVLRSLIPGSSPPVGLNRTFLAKRIRTSVQPLSSQHLLDNRPFGGAADRLMDRKSRSERLQRNEQVKALSNLADNGRLFVRGTDSWKRRGGRKLSCPRRLPTACGHERFSPANAKRLLSMHKNANTASIAVANKFVNCSSECVSLSVQLITRRSSTAANGGTLGVSTYSLCSNVSLFVGLRHAAAACGLGIAMHGIARRDIDPS